MKKRSFKCAVAHNSLGYLIGSHYEAKPVNYSEQNRQLQINNNNNNKKVPEAKHE